MRKCDISIGIFLQCSCNVGNSIFKATKTRSILNYYFKALLEEYQHRFTMFKRVSAASMRCIYFDVLCFQGNGQFAVELANPLKLTNSVVVYQRNGQFSEMAIPTYSSLQAPSHKSGQFPRHHHARDFRWRSK
jgi:hypothetical protein